MIAKTLDSNRASDPRSQAGAEAERKMAFYLRRAFEHERYVWVFNDLRLVRTGDAAQIDHLVLHRSGMVLVESKSVTGEIAVNERGEWTRRTNGFQQGIESPVVQARLQAEFLRRLMMENDGRVLDGQLGGLLPKHFNKYWPIEVRVAVSDSGRITRGMEVPELLKADQVAGVIREIVRRHRRGRFSPNPFNSDATYTLTPVEMGRLVAFLLASHAPLGRATWGVTAAPSLAEPFVGQAYPAAVPPPAEPTLMKRPPVRPICEDNPLHRRRYNGDRPIEIVKELKVEYPDHIVFVQNGSFWEVYEDDADVCSRLFGWRTASHGTGPTFTGVPTNARKFKERLEEEGLSYIMVAQTGRLAHTGCIERAPVELFKANQA